VRDDGLADPAQCERRHCDSELRGRDVSVKVVEQAEQAFGLRVAGRSHRLDARAAHADEGKFRGDKEPVCENQKDDQQDVKNCVHDAVIFYDNWP
jgi:hypothetical protein